MCEASCHVYVIYVFVYISVYMCVYLCMYDVYNHDNIKHKHTVLPYYT